jgi:hypothetical protein
MKQKNKSKKQLMIEYYREMAAEHQEFGRITLKAMEKVVAEWSL